MDNVPPPDDQSVPNHWPGAPLRDHPGPESDVPPSGVPVSHSPRNRATARSELTRLHDRAMIADLHINHHLTTREIAAKMGISQSQVVRDMGVLKREWRAEAKTLYSDAAQEQLDLLDDAAQLLRQAFQRSVDAADEPETTDIGSPGDDGKIKTQKSIRVRRAKPYSVAAASGLVKVAKAKAAITGTIKQAGVTPGNGDEANDALSGLTYQERVEKVGQMILDAAQRAREQGKLPPLPSENRLHESGEPQTAALPGSPTTAPPQL